MTAMDGKARLVKVTPTISAAAYADDDQLGNVLTFSNALDSSSDTGAVLSFQVVDKAKQKAAFDLLLFNSLPTVTSTDNNPLDIADSEMADKFIGRISVAATDYRDTVSNSDATVLGIGLLLQGLLTEHIYGVLQCQGSPTYTSTSDLVIKLGILQD